ncbi:type II secretion system F family protein [Ruania halotolerans]|uniref:type II secretion system F family protein n=1 Tax=Ruania halotolerans TaxID=2897773 RepID=UPI001E3FE39B|nr:type II secretion protein F [Ruania halotolerans]UFU07135.1 type II secretion protein F [Ruania halotolerans]
MTELLAALLVMGAAAILTIPGRGVPLPGARVLPRRRRRARRRRGRTPEEPVGALLVEVAARLRTGAAISVAWDHTLRNRPDVPAELAALAHPAGRPGPGAAGTSDRRGVRRGIGNSADRSGPRAQAVAGAVAAVRVAEHLGAPLADVLDSCAHGVAEAEEAASGRRTALAAPRATARLLTWLPVAGMLMGAALGADPLVLLDGSWGTVCLVGGIVLLVAGHRWTTSLVRVAERAGSR